MTMKAADDGGVIVLEDHVLFHIVDGREMATLNAADFRRIATERDDLERQLAEATEQLRRQGEVVEAARRIGGLLQGYRWSEKSDNSMLTAMQEHYDAIRALEAAVPAAPNAAELASIAAGKADIAAGRFKVFDSVEALIDDLNTPSADREAEGAS